MSALWTSPTVTAWRAALERYPDVLAAQGVARLPDLDAWYQHELPPTLALRDPAHATLAELVRLTEWKMARGVWRGPNLALVRSNAPDTVESTTRDALRGIPHPTAPVATLSTLAGVGPATASALVAAAAPALYPFFDELVAAQVPALGPVRWTLGYYRRYADALRARADALGDDWTPARVERALWATAGGKAGAT